jgi:phosphoheptose isomerase
VNPIDELIERHPELEPIEPSVRAAFELLYKCLRRGLTVYTCGNGGSASDAEHIVGELMKGMVRRRPISPTERESLRETTPPHLGVDADDLSDRLDGALRAVCLSSQNSLLTAIANDLGPHMGFAQQVFGYGRPGDVLWAISTSGRSQNVTLAALAARARKMPVLAMTGEEGQPLGDLATVWIKVPASDVGAAQELHLPIYHALCRALEESCFPSEGE